MPTFVGGLCECKEKGGCIGGIPNDSYEPKKPPKGEEPSDVSKGEPEPQPALEGEEPTDAAPHKKKGWFW